MSKYYKRGKKQIGHVPESDENNIYFEGWAIHKASNKYWVSYISAMHGGEKNTFSIDEEKFEFAKKGSLNLLDLIKEFE